MTNPVHALQARVQSEAVGASCFLVSNQQAYYRAITAARHKTGMTMAEVETKIGLGERHLNKIEPARDGEKKYMRLPFRMTYTSECLHICYGYRLMLVPEEIAEMLLDEAPPSPVRLTTAQRRRADIMGEQMDLPLPSPVERVCVGQVEEGRKRKAALRKLEKAA